MTSVAWYAGVILFALALSDSAFSQITQYGFDDSGSVITRRPQITTQPQILGQPQAQIAAPGELASFSVVMVATRALSYQWRFNGTNMPSRTNDALLLLNASINNEGPYDVVVSNLSGSVTSIVAQLYIDSDRDGLPDSWELTYFGNLTSQRGGGDADGDGVSNLAEFLDGTNPTNSGSRNLRLTILSDGGSVAVAPTKLSYTNGEAVTLTATPFPPNAFHAWTGDINTSDNPLALLMNTSKTIRARFISALPPPGMVGWWRAENNALDALGANPGTLSNGVAFVAGKVGQAFHFSATNQEVKVPASPSVNVGAGAGLTIEMWIKPDDLQTQRPLAEWNDGTNIAVHFWLNVGFSGQGGPGAIYMNLRDQNLGDHYFFSPAGLVGTNNWQHVAVTYDRPSGNAKLYFNGLAVSSVSLGSYVPRTTANLHLGYRPASVSYSGLMDEPALYNRALTPTEVLGLYLADAAGKSPITPYITSPPQFADALVGTPYTQQVVSVFGTPTVTYSLSAGALPGLTFSPSGLLSGVPTTPGSNTFAVLATDAAGLSSELVCGLNVLPSDIPAMPGGLLAWWRAENDGLDSAGTNHGALTSGTSFAAGKVGQAFSFNGATNYVQVGNNPGLNFSNSLSIEAWIFPTGAGSASPEGGIILGKENQYEVARFADGTIRWAFANSSPGWNWVSSGFVAPLNQWTHIVVAYNNGAVNTYANGELVQSYGGSGPIGFAALGQNDCRIAGRQTTSQYFQGRIDEVSLYRDFLSGEQVASLYNAGYAGKITVGPYINTASQLPDAIIGQAYSQTITAIRGTPQISFAVTDGALPSGLALNSSGVLSGTPTNTGTFNFTIRATDASALSNSQAFAIQVYTKIAPLPGIVGWWRAENNALDSVGTNNGVLKNGAGFGSGKLGQAFALDGGSQSIDVPDAPELRPASVTLESWVLFNGDGGIRVIAAKPVGTGFLDSYAIWLNNGVINAGIGDTNGSGTTLAAAFPSGSRTWHHVAYTFDDADKAQALYVDGAPVSSGVVNRTIGYDGQPLLWGRDTESGSPTYFFPGRIDEAAIYSRALGTGEIALLYGAGPAGKTASGPYFSTPPVLPIAVASRSYTQALVTVRGALPIGYSLVSGALPGGIGLDAGGALTGIPTNTGTFNFTVRATDSASLFGVQNFTLTVAPKVPPPAGLISWWRAENDALDSAGLNDGTPVNGATFAPGKAGQAFSFDGADDTVEIQDAPSLHPASLTLESWVLFFSSGGTQVIMSKGIGSGTAQSFILWYANGSLNGAVTDSGGGASPIAAAFTPVIGRWYHIAFTFDNNTKQQYLYLDGVAVAAGVSNRSVGYDSHSILLGADEENGSLAYFLSGRIDEAAIYSRALAAGEIATLYSADTVGKTPTGPYVNTSPFLPDGGIGQTYTQVVTSVRGSAPATFSVISGSLPPGLALNSAGMLSGVPTSAGNFIFVIRVTDAASSIADQLFSLNIVAPIPPPAGLISWWRAENNALDAAGSNNGVLTNGTSFTAGKVGSAFSLDGVNDYVHIPDALSLRPPSVTLETWVLFNATGTRVIVGKPVGGGTSDSYQIYLSGGTLGAFVGDAASAGTPLSIPFSPVLGRWYHVAFTFDDDTRQQVLYLDGITVASGLGDKRIGYDAQPFLLGCDVQNGNRAFFFQGRIDEAAIFNRALTANEIAAFYDAGAAGKTTVGPYFSTAPLLPDVVFGQPYAQAITVVRGTPSLVYSLEQGALPDGLALNSNGLLSGTPTSAGENTFVVRVADSAGLTAEQIYTLAVFAPVAEPNGLVAWWKADNNALDSAGTNHGTMLGGATFAAGEVNAAFDLNGTSAFVAISNSAWLNPVGPFSLEAWIKASSQQFSPDRQFLIVDKSHGFADGTGWVLQGNADGTAGFYFGRGGNSSAANFVGVNTIGIVQDDHWHHLAGVFTGSQIVIFKDGVLQNSLSASDLPAGNPRDVEIGRSWGGGSPLRYFHGLIDEASYYNRALLPDEILGIYKAGPAGKGNRSGLPPLLRAAAQGSMLTISFNGTPGVTYTVQYASNLDNNAWAILSNIMAATTNVVFYDSLTNSHQRFYRVMTIEN